MTGTRLWRFGQACLATALFLLSPAQVGAQEKVFINSLGMEFVLIPAGTFVMGSPPDEPMRNESESRHQVTLSKPYYIQTTEVTLAQWRQLMGKGVFGFLNRRKGPDQMPVTRVCMHDTAAFLKRLNALGEGRYRLPTEAEWEYAARAGTQSAYSWGDQIDCARAMYANKKGQSDACVPYAESRGFLPDNPAPVRSYAPNPWGLYDMHGNVWEWCQDGYGRYPSGHQTDPQGPLKAKHHIRRGGSWFGNGHKCRSANRASGHPGSRLRNTGFRVVRLAQP